MQIRNAQGERLEYSYQRGIGEIESDWLFIIGHGVTGNKDRPIVQAAAHAINEVGYDTLAFSFAGNGQSGGRFQDSNITKEIEDLGSVLDAFANRKIAYVGHSMGAAVGVLRAASDQRIRILISLAGMVDTRKFAQTEFGDETPDQGLMWEDANCPLSSSFMSDLCETVISVKSTAREIEIPWLLLHGSADDVVLIEDSQSIENLAKPQTSLKIISGGDHSFNGEARDPAMEALKSWIVDQGLN